MPSNQGVLPVQQPPPSSSPQPMSSPLSPSDTKDVESAVPVDPSFLAALPEDLRRMVLEEQEKVKRAMKDPASPAEVVRVGQLNILGFRSGPGVGYNNFHCSSVVVWFCAVGCIFRCYTLVYIL